MSLTVTGFERDGLQFAVAIPADAPDLTSATASAAARLVGGGPEIDAATATIEAAAIAVDFGPGALAPGVYSVQVGVTLGGRFTTLWAGAATVSESLGD